MSGCGKWVHDGIFVCILHGKIKMWFNKSNKVDACLCF